MIGEIHQRFLEAGSDIIETNTFGSNAVSQSDFFREHKGSGRKGPSFYQEMIEDTELNDLVWEMNFESAQLCRKWCDRIGSDTGRKRYVAGAIGPMTIGLHQIIDSDQPEFRSASFEQVATSYEHQIRALIAGGVDILMVETIFDALNAKAALVSIKNVFEVEKIELPLIISAAVGRGGETMTSAQRVDAFWNAGRPSQAPCRGFELFPRPRRNASLHSGVGQNRRYLYFMLSECR